MFDPRKISSMDASKRVGTFKKDDQIEEFFSLVNSSLQSLEKSLVGQAQRPHPSIFILSPPRSGSTLASQILCTYLDVGYPSNLMARFYGSPRVGAYFHRELIGRTIEQATSFSSIHGVTKGIEQPHEFGYFWSRYLRCAGNLHQPMANDDLSHIDVKQLQSDLDDMSSIVGKPMIYKLPLGVFYLKVLSQLSNVVFIFLERNTQATARSILNVREERLGDIRNWWSFRTQNYDQLQSEAPEIQAESQVAEIKNAIQQGRTLLTENRYFSISYESMIQSPDELIVNTIELIKNNFNLTMQRRGVVDASDINNSPAQPK